MEHEIHAYRLLGNISEKEESDTETDSEEFPYFF